MADNIVYRFTSMLGLVAAMLALASVTGMAAAILGIGRLDFGLLLPVFSLGLAAPLAVFIARGPLKLAKEATFFSDSAELKRLGLTGVLRAGLQSLSMLLLAGFVFLMMGPGPALAVPIGTGAGLSYAAVTARRMEAEGAFVFVVPARGHLTRLDLPSRYRGEPVGQDRGPV